MLWPQKGSVMKTQTWILDNRLYYTRKIELHRKGKKSHTVFITPIVICPSGSQISVLITVRRVHYSKMGKVPTTVIEVFSELGLFLSFFLGILSWLHIILFIICWAGYGDPSFKGVVLSDNRAKYRSCLLSYAFVSVFLIVCMFLSANPFAWG